MRKSSKTASIVNLIGIDGSGKSATAVAAAEQLTAIFVDSQVNVTDNDGLRRYRGGELIAHIAPEVEYLQPKAFMNRALELGSLASFMAARRTINAFHGPDLHISVRDPHRIDPALYAGVYGVPILRRLSPFERLRFFNSLTIARPADLVLQLSVDPNEAVLTSDVDFDRHEGMAQLATAADELPQLAKAYRALHGSRYESVDGQRPETTSNVVNHLCSIINNR